MPAAIAPLTARPAWRALVAHQAGVRDLTLRELFAADPARGQQLTAEGPGVFLDYSKNRVTDETVRLLLRLAEESGLQERIAAMFRGDKINVSENRAVLHIALRAPRDASIVVDGHDVVPEVHAVLDKMAAFANRVRGGDWKGHTGKRIRNVINSSPAWRRRPGRWARASQPAWAWRSRRSGSPHATTSPVFPSSTTTSTRSVAMVA